LGKYTQLRTIPLNSSQSSYPSKPWQSKLTPYAREIAAWRGQRPPKPYAEIAALLREKHGLSVHPDTVHSFVKVRSKGGPKYLKISPQFLKERGIPNGEITGAAQRNRSPMAARLSSEGSLGATPPTSYPVVNPNQL